MSFSDSELADINLGSFLDFGYFLHYKNQNVFPDLSRLDESKYAELSEDELIDIGIMLWEKMISDQYREEDTHVVPLSGGIDSRAILATLLKHTSAEKIHTYTYGTPGSLDYEIGNEIAKRCGTNHRSFPLTEYNYNMDELIDASKRVDHQTLLFLHGPISEIDRSYADCQIWSGTIIDVFFGRHTHLKKASNWTDAILNSFDENQFTKSHKLSKHSYNDYIDLVDIDDRYCQYFEREHIIDLMNRQVKFVEPHVLMDGLNYKILFNNELSDFANCLPIYYRENQNLYFKIFMRAYPELFSIRTKTSFGLSLQAPAYAKFMKRSIDKIFGRSVKRNINYLNFSEKIIEDKDLNRIFTDNIYDLRDRKLLHWIDPVSILKSHMKKERDLSDALIPLVSLEIHLKSGLVL